MRKGLLILALCALAFAGGLALAFLHFKSERVAPPDPPALVTQMREVARLETLDVTLYKKVSFEPDPEPARSLWGDVSNWVKFSVSPPKGKAIIFADVHLGLDISKLQASGMRVDGDRIDIVLPPLLTQVELKPEDTEVIGSNLDTAQTAQLFALAKTAFEREVSADPALAEKARRSAERALKGLLLGAGFREVRFVDHLPLTLPAG